MNLFLQIAILSILCSSFCSAVNGSFLPECSSESFQKRMVWKYDSSRIFCVDNGTFAFLCDAKFLWPQYVTCSKEDPAIVDDLAKEMSRWSCEPSNSWVFGMTLECPRQNIHTHTRFFFLKISFIF